tara:strand:- start:12324 stop:12467 length:144 start_codon:yes stop_codon:yes gene_type:complete
MAWKIKDEILELIKKNKFPDIRYYTDEMIDGMSEDKLREHIFEQDGK